MEVKNGFQRNGQASSTFVNYLERVPIAADFLFIAIAKKRFTKNNCTHPPPINLYSLDSV